MSFMAHGRQNQHVLYLRDHLLKMECDMLGVTIKAGKRCERGKRGSVLRYLPAYSSSFPLLPPPRE